MITYQTKIKKRKQLSSALLCVLVALTLCVGLIGFTPATVHAATATYTSPAGVTYELDSDAFTAKITATAPSGTLTSADANLITPTGLGAPFDGNLFTVTEIAGTDVFKGWRFSGNVSFGSLTTISGSYAFNNCNLTDVDFPVLSTVTGRDCFYYATIGSGTDLSAITEVTGDCFCFVSRFPQGYNFANLTTIRGEEAFSDCKLANVNFPVLSTVTGEDCFSDATFGPNTDLSALTEVDGDYFCSRAEYPDGYTFANLTTMNGDKAFYYTYLVDVDFPVLSTVTGSDCFYYAYIGSGTDLSALTNITSERFCNYTKFPQGHNFASLTTISGEDAFRFCDLTDVDFPALSSMTAIDCFSYSTIGSGTDLSALTEIQGSAFCRSVKFPQGYNFANLTTISRAAAFADCDLTNVYFPVLTTVTGGACFPSATFADNTEFPALTTISGNLFANSAKNLSSMEMPALTSIGSDAFYGDADFTNYTLPSTPPTVATNSNFPGCPTPRALTLPSITDMPTYAAVAADGDRLDHKWYGWDLSDISYIIFDANGGTMAVATDDGYRVGNNGTALSGTGTELQNIPADPTAPVGMEFDGWYTAATGGTKVTNFSFPATEFEIQTLYAQYTLKEFDVTFANSNTAAGSLTGADAQKVKYGEFATAGATATPTPPVAPATETEYEFIGWSYSYTAEDGSTQTGTVMDYTTVAIESDVLFTAQWAKKPFVSVTAANGYVLVGASTSPVGTDTNSKYEIPTTTPLPTPAVIGFKPLDDTYELASVTVTDLYGHTLDLGKVSGTPSFIYGSGDWTPRL